MSTDGINDDVASFHPVREFRNQLRRVHADAGKPTLAAMSRRGGGSTGGLSEVLNKGKLPTAEATRKLLLGCGIEATEVLEEWEARRKAAESQAKLLSPDLDGCTSEAQLQEAIKSLLAARSIDGASLRYRSSRLGHELTPGDAEKVVAGTYTLERATLELAVSAAGGLPEDVAQWLCCYDRILSPTGLPPAVVLDSADGGGSPAIDRATRTPAVARLGAPAARAAVSALAALLVLAGSGWIALRTRQGDRHETMAAPIERPPSPHPEEATTTVSASDKLRTLARRVQALHERTAYGPYTYVHRQLWTVRPANHSDGDADLDDVRLWWSPDGAVHRIETETPAGQPHSEPPQDVQFAPGELHIPVPEPSTDPAQLAVQLAAQAGADTSAAGLMHAVDTMNDYHNLDARQRAAVLQLLSQTSGINYRGQFIDREGRTGVAFSADTDNGSSVTRDTLSFDESTGALLAHEAARTADGGTPAGLGLTQNVYLERGASSIDS